jgi:type I restriction enzyme S subunit
MMLEVIELPEGWCWATIADLCELNPKHDRSCPPDLPVSFVPMAAVCEVDGRIVSPEVRPLGEVSRGYTHFADGDVIFAKITPCMENGKAASVRGMVNGLACGTTEFFVLRPRGAVDQDYLFHFIRQESFRRAARATMQSGVGQARVPKEFVLATEVPIAPIAEQLRIVAKIEALQAHGRKAREALKDIPPLLAQFRRSLLAAAFRGDLTSEWRVQHPDVEPASVLLSRMQVERRRQYEEKYPTKKYVEPEPVDESDLPDLPEGWCWASIEELSCLITSGSRDWSRYYNIGTGTFIMAQNVRPGVLDFSNGRQLVGPPPDDRDRARSQVACGDLLITIVGANTGDICPVEGTLPDHYVCQSVALIRPVVRELQRTILYYFLAGAPGRDRLNKVIYGQGRPHLGFEDLRRMPVPVPPFAEQDRLLSAISSCQVAVRSIECELRAALNDLEFVDQSILAKAFCGELVAQDSSDEPASALLTRIRGGQEANGEARGPRRRKSLNPR